LTTFDQRRLIKQQVRAGLLVAPIAANTKFRDDKKSKGKLWDSGDEESSSEEDFKFISERIRATGELDEQTMKLLRGVVHEPYKERKHPERYKRPGAIIDEESFPEDSAEQEIDLTKISRSQAGRQYRIELDPNEPGISREEQLRRMNIVAKEFNFFAVDRPDQTSFMTITPGPDR